MASGVTRSKLPETTAPPIAPPARPRSAVSHGVGLAGLVGLLGWLVFARTVGTDLATSPIAPMLAIGNADPAMVAAYWSLIACGLPMILWSLLVDKVHLRASTGIDWSNPRPVHEILDISIVKLAGLWATWGIIALIYAIGRWYWSGAYLVSMEIFAHLAPVLLIASIPYVIWLDRYLVHPRDGAWSFGQLFTGQATSADRQAIARHLRAWAVKGFFLAFMISIVPWGFMELVELPMDQVLRGPVELAHYSILLMFLCDVHFATVGYLLTMRPLDAHIRTANPYLAGWVAALMCYPPFQIMVATTDPLFYEYDTGDWAFWFANYPVLLWSVGAALVFLTGIYGWATVSFGIRFSNLTHRGILTHGPYSVSRHPAYVSKNLYWWLATIPFLTVTGSWADGARNAVLLLGVNAIYYWRAKTEEKHLLGDPVYREYYEWMQAHGAIPRLFAWITRRPRPLVALAPTVPAIPER